MIMDSKYPAFSDYTNLSKVDEETIFPKSDQYPNIETEFKFDIPSPDPNFMNVPFDHSDPNPDNFGLFFNLSPEVESFVPFTSLSPNEGSSNPSSVWSPDGEASSPSEDSDSSDPVLSYISQMLMEENMEDKPHMYYDPLALQATEQSMYDALGEQYLSSPNSPLPYINYESPDGNLWGSDSDYGGNTSTSIGTGTDTVVGKFVDSQWVGDAGQLNPSLLQRSPPDDLNFQSNLQPTSQFSVNPSNVQPHISDGLIGSSVSEMVQKMFNDRETMLQFKRGLEEASKFLPSANQLITDLESNVSAMGQKEEPPTVVVEEKIGSESSLNGSRSRKYHEREDSDLEGRNNKQSAVYVEEGELSELFDKVLLWPGIKGEPCDVHETEQDGASKTSQLDKQTNVSNGGKNRAKKQGRKKEMVDLRTLLMLCAQAISTNDFRTANELLKQVRQHSSPNGDGSQRLAHVFANGLEARLVGTGVGIQTYSASLASKRTTAADMLKAYKTHLHACPFKKLSILFANKMILKAAQKTATLHVVDFGVLYGYQWPVLIQKLSSRPGGPPKLRLTGIELPQHGFRPAERIEETGRRLAKYCERFKVPFEYNPIAAQNWENIPIEDLKINSNEVLAVNCLYRFKSLLDETAAVNCPRDAILNLIRKMNPDIFVHSITNGSYNAPFFVTRFREALFHFSLLFDMFDSTLPSGNQERLMFETEIHGREAMNAIACEGVERVERPETYKQWQVRTTRAGFKPLRLDQEIMEMMRAMLKDSYHRDFVIDEDSHWVLQGWKGRIFYASSCWVPA